MSTLERAIVIAAEAHAGMTDKAGAPYILHPLRMMMDLTSPEERIVAVLHDVCEDCPGWTFERLRGEGFSEEILAAKERRRALRGIRVAGGCKSNWPARQTCRPAG